MLATLDLALQFGDRENVRFTRANLLYHSTRLGRWDELLEEADRFIAECETSPHNMETAARELRGDVRFARGDVEAALADWERAIALAREMESPERLLPGLLRLARGLVLLGRQDEARVLVAEGMEIAGANPSTGDMLAIVADQATALGVAQEIVAIIEQAPGGTWKDAALTAARGERSRAADMYERIGLLSIAAEVRFGAAEVLLEEVTQTRGSPCSTRRLRSTGRSARRSSSSAARHCLPGLRETRRRRARSGRSCRRCSRRSRRRRRRARRGARRSHGRPRAPSRAPVPPADRGRRART